VVHGSKHAFTNAQLQSPDEGTHGEPVYISEAVEGGTCHSNYYAVPGNLDSLGVFRERLIGQWWRTLRRRSQKHPISWERTLALANRWLPQPRVLHPYPAVRFAASHPR
jgi:hypothetical protein